MIFYFTGTGNSFHIAQNISKYNNENLISISDEIKKKNKYNEYYLKEDEKIGFVFPVYAWGPPRIVVDFINNLKINNYNKNYIFSIATCGENIGNTMEVLRKSLKNKELILNSGFSIVMPNNYILLGNIDNEEIEKEKLIYANDRLQMINKIINERKKDIFDLEKGFMPAFLTSVINPIFNKYGINTKKFYATDECTSCGLCEKVCSIGSIKVDKKPTWNKECTQCLACIHRCPTKAIQYGKGTLKKGRYINPDLI